jgi:ribose-phosphate pyrophosphokinase
VHVDAMVTVDVHNVAAFQNAFRIPTEHLEARPLQARHFAAFLRGQPIAVLSPDSGGLKRASALAADLEVLRGEPVPVAFTEKYRSEGVLTGGRLVGDVADRAVLVVDDLVGTGTTLQVAALAARAHGALSIHCAATHGVFAGSANAVFAGPEIDSMTITDTIESFRLVEPRARSKLQVIETAALVGDAIRALHEGGSIEALRLVPAESA